ncbi:unnamed protein product [Rhizophagus irregularis]|nr:unnamed protein product [Rhizophagus irregularis]
MQETEESIAEFSKFCLEIQLANNFNNDENKVNLLWLIHKVVFIKILSTLFPDYVHSGIVVPIYDELRTSLHGILASCELMEESKLNEA